MSLINFFTDFYLCSINFLHKTRQWFHFLSLVSLIAWGVPYEKPTTSVFLEFPRQLLEIYTRFLISSSIDNLNIDDSSARPATPPSWIREKRAAAHWPPWVSRGYQHYQLSASLLSLSFLWLICKNNTKSSNRKKEAQRIVSRPKKYRKIESAMYYIRIR